MAALQVRIDPELHDQAMEVCNSLGIDISKAIRMFCKRLVKDKALPFTPIADTSDGELGRTKRKKNNSDTAHGKNL